jgi:putative FmdB family regulatory protein
MPIFEYICRDCGRSFERIVPRHDSETDCLHCNSQNIEKQLSVFAVAGDRSTAADAIAEGGCGRCGAPQPGMCQMLD